MKNFLFVLGLFLLVACGNPNGKETEPNTPAQSGAIRNGANRVNDGESEPLIKKTLSGAEFKRVSEAELKAAGVTDPKKFGEAWQDPSGMIWGDIAKKDNGSPLFMNHHDAEAYCKSLGAELPSGWPEDENGKNGFPNRDSDFVRLRKFMGAKFVARYGAPEGYTAQILPNLTTKSESGPWFSGSHWSSSVLPVYTGNAYVFYGRDGDVFSHDRSYVYYVSVRCVVRAARVDR